MHSSWDKGNELALCNNEQRHAAQWTQRIYKSPRATVWVFEAATNISLWPKNDHMQPTD